MSCHLGASSARSSQKPASLRNHTHQSAAYGVGLSSASSAISKDPSTALQGTNKNPMTQDLQSLPMVTSVQQQHHQPQADLTVETQKRKIREHPLYPLLALLFRQCETGTIRPTSPPALEMFEEDLREFIARKERECQHEDSSDAAIAAATTKDRPQSSSSPASTKHPHHHHHQSNQLYLQPRLAHTKDKGGGNLNGNDCAAPSVRRHSYSAGPVSANAAGYSPSQSESHFEDGGKNGVRKTEARSPNEIPLSVFVDNRDLDELIVQAIMVLRIHLLELHKVNELSKDFCSRYIDSLKTRFRSELMFQDSDPSSPDGSEALSPYLSGHYQSYLPMCAGTYGNHGYKLDELLPGSFGGGGGDMQAGHPPGLSGEPCGPDSSDGSHRHSSEPTGGFTCNSHLNPAANGYLGPNSYLNELKINGGTGRGFPVGSYFPPRAAAVAAALNAGLDSINCGGGSGSGSGAGSKTKRGVLPKRATQVMKQWLFQHLVHPYPTENEKMEIAQQTNLTLLQVNNWFINARRRILQPMLDSSSSFSLTRYGSDGRGPNGTKTCDSPMNKKKKAATSRPSNNRFWPASLAAAAVLHPVAAGLISPNSSLQQSEATALGNPRSTYHAKTPAGTEPADASSDAQERQLSRVKCSPPTDQQVRRSSLDGASPEGKRGRPIDDYSLSFETAAATAQTLADMELQQCQPPPPLSAGFGLNGGENGEEKSELRRSAYLSQASAAERNRLLEAGRGLQNMHVSGEKNGIPVAGDDHDHQQQIRKLPPAHGYAAEEQQSRHFLNCFARSKLENHFFSYEAQDLVSYQSHLLSSEKQENHHPHHQREAHTSSELAHFSTSTDISGGLEPMFMPRYSAHNTNNNWYQCNSNHMDEAASDQSRYPDLRETSGGDGVERASYGSFPQQTRMHEHGAAAAYVGQSCLPGTQMYGHTPRQTANAAAAAAASAAAAAWAAQSFTGFPGNSNNVSSNNRNIPFHYLHLPSSQQLWGAASSYCLPHGFGSSAGAGAGGGADFPRAAATSCSQKTELSPSSSSAASAYRFPGDLSGSGGDSGGSQKPSPTDHYAHTGHHHQQQQQSGLADEVQGCKETLVNN